MSIEAQLWDEVRTRAELACEFCGVSEIDVGGKLTVDHHIPLAFGGTDDFSNLIYACHSCNQFKHHYFPVNDADIPIWNPRIKKFSAHFIELENGHLEPLTQIGKFTIQKLRLNRIQLINHRLQKKEIENERRQNADLIAYRDTIQKLTKRVYDSQTENNSLETEQEKLYKFILSKLK